jgi:HK97 family phage major capsid protein/HK97 family phage prohead protease
MSQKIRIPETMFRSAQFERAAINEDERTVEMSISSEEPYKRFFGNEILDHKAECVNLKRFAGGAPLLFNHDRGAHIGRIIETRLEGGKLVVKAKFGNSALAQEKWQDVKDGILRETSVGYQVTKMVLEEEKDDDSTYRVTEWMPYEGSLVTIPADQTVGVGRASETRELEIFRKSENPIDDNSQKCESSPTSKPAMPETTEQTKASEPNIVVVRDEAVQAERKRVTAIQESVKHFANVGLMGRKVDTSAIAADFIAKGGDVRDFEGAVLRGNPPEIKTLSLKEGEIGMNEKEKGAFSLLRACRTLASSRPLDGLEKEVSDAASKHISDAKPNAIYLPQDITNHRSLETRAQTAGVFSAGGATVQNNYGSMIEYLRNKTVLGQLGVTQLNGLTGDFVMPVQTGGVTFAWVSETGALSDSEATFGQKTLTPHRGGATTPYSTQFLAQSSLSAESFFRQELMTATAIGVDLAGLEGTGVSGQPLGLKNTTGINATVTFGGAATWADIVEFETGIATDNADIGSMGFAISAATCGKWKTILRDSVAGAGYLIDNGMNANGYSVVRTNQITGSIVFFGVWNQLLHAMWATQEVIVDPYALKKSGQVEITLNTFHDFLVRQPLAFNVSTDSGAQ